MRLPKRLVAQLNLKPGSKLAIKCNHVGFVLCKMNEFETWEDQLQTEIQAFDDDVRKAASLMAGIFKRAAESSEKRKLIVPIDK